MVPLADICDELGETLTVIAGEGAALLVVELPPPPLHETCCVMAISASHLATARILEQGEGEAPRTSG
jgi:hypothetical protein